MALKGCITISVRKLSIISGMTSIAYLALAMRSSSLSRSPCIANVSLSMLQKNTSRYEQMNFHDASYIYQECPQIVCNGKITKADNGAYKSKVHLNSSRHITRKYS